MKSITFSIFKKRKIELFFILIAIYLSFSVFFAFERMLNTDCSLQLFHIINYKTFFFQENRFGVWLTQIPLLLAIYIHVPIKFIVYIYSISFPLFYFLIIWINYKIFKSKEAALATILSLIIGVAFSFFHAITETHQLLALSCLLFGLLQSKEKFSKPYYFYITLVLLLIWCLFTHPNAIFTIFFVVGLVFLQKKITRLDVILLISLSVFFTLIKILLTSKSSYDASLYDRLLNFKETLPNFFSLYSFRYLYTKYLTTYLAGFCIIIIVWLKYKKYKELIFCSICFSGFTILTILTFSDGDCEAIMEKSYMPGFFMFILIYSIFIYQTKNKVTYYIITLLLSLSSFINIINASEPYTKRLNLLSSIIKNTDKQTPKIIANFTDYDPEILKFNNWATSMDVLILSSCNSDTSKTIFLVDNKNQYFKEITDSNLFLYRIWDPFIIKKLNTDYFHLLAVPYKIYDISEKISLKAKNGKFICADIYAGSKIVANRDMASNWETFFLMTLDKNTFAIRTFDNHYFCAELRDQSEITATRTAIGDWEKFTVIKFSSNFVAFKAANGKYLSVDEKTLQIYAKSDSLGKSEKFEIIPR